MTYENFLIQMAMGKSVNYDNLDEDALFSVYRGYQSGAFVQDENGDIRPTEKFTKTFGKLQRGYRRVQENKKSN